MMTDDKKFEEARSFQTLEPRNKRRQIFQWRDSWLDFLPGFIVFYSFIKEIKVGEPFMFKYQTEVLNFTSEQLSSEVVLKIVVETS